MDTEKTKAKTISVVMCTYNGERFIREQLDSIVSQTYPIYELIIQDDCSSDNTIEIIKEYVPKYKYIKLYQNKQNIGFNLNFKTAILKATGDYIAISDQDDIWYENKLEKQINAITKYSLCTTECHRDSSYSPNSMNQIIRPIITFEYLLFASSIPGHSMLTEKDFVQETISKWDNSINYDWWIAINAHLYQGIICVNEPLNWHRPHNKSAITLHLYKYDKTSKEKRWQPYIYGYRAYKRLQQLQNWKVLYTYINKKTSPHNHSLIHTLSKLLLQDNPISTFKLCYLCLVHRNVIYYSQNKNSLFNYLRSFCWPFIRSYKNVSFYY